MRRTALALGLVAAFAQPATAIDVQTFDGWVRENEVDTHTYSYEIEGCPEPLITYDVRLTYAPPSAALQLAAGGIVVDGENGVASLRLWDGYCATFDITVTGVAVAGSAPYVVSVVKNSTF
jgi:hypothetical protein